MGNVLAQNLGFPSSTHRSAQTLCLAWGKSQTQFPICKLTVSLQVQYCQGREEPERGSLEEQQQTPPFMVDWEENVPHPLVSDPNQFKMVLMKP